MSLICVCIFLITQPALAQSILIIKNNASSIHNQISTLVETELKNTFSSNDIATLNETTTNRKQLIILQPSLIITLGKNAAMQVQHYSVKKLHALIPESFLSSLLTCAPEPCSEASQSFALHLEQPLKRQLNLLRILLPNTEKIGTLTSQSSIEKVRKLEKYITDLKLQFFYNFFQNGDSLNRKLDELLGHIDVFLALPDPLIHNSMTIEHLLLYNYRREIPVIGFSKAYVDSGAIAAVYSTPAQISRQISELSVNILSEKPPEPGSYAPDLFSIAINEHVARSLGLAFPNPESIKLKLIALEK